MDAFFFFDQWNNFRELVLIIRVWILVLKQSFILSDIKGFLQGDMTVETNIKYKPANTHDYLPYCSVPLTLNFCLLSFLKWIPKSLAPSSPKLLGLHPEYNRVHPAHAKNNISCNFPTE